MEKKIQISELQIDSLGELSQPKQIKVALEFIQNLNYSMIKIIEDNSKAKAELKKLKSKIKASPVMVALKNLSKQIKDNEKALEELAARRMGAIGLCEKQGIKIEESIKNIKLLK